jgi:uncharacterized membrane protein
MIFLRVLVLVLLTGVVVCVLAWVFTRERRYLRLAWRLLVGGLFAALVFFAVLFVERLTAERIATEPTGSPPALSGRQSDGVGRAGVDRETGIAALRVSGGDVQPGGPVPS